MAADVPCNSTVELANVVLRLRRDLRFSLQQYGQEPCYLVEDEKNSRFYRIGIPEYTFLSLLDGTTPLGEALAHTAGILGPQALTHGDAAGICKWLVDCGLAQSDASHEHERIWKQAQQTEARKRWQRLNPLVIRLPLLRPDRWLRRVTAIVGWWFSWPMFSFWLTTLTVALYQLATYWQQRPVESSQVFARENLLWLAVTWCLMKVAHETSHGVACQRFGGQVREAGLLLILFAPVPYVDVTSAWRFRSKWQRIMVSAAGMYTEIFLAALAAVVWVRSDHGVVAQQAFNVMITASVVTVLFNANPLMRFDGYYMLSDWLELPNLYGQGRQYLGYVLRRYLLGMKTKCPLDPGMKGRFVRIYAWASLAWRLLVSVSILLAAAVLFEGAGILLAVGTAAVWLGLLLVPAVQWLRGKSLQARPRWSRVAMSVLLLAGIATGLAFLPEPGGTRAPAVVRFAAQETVRAPHDGFIEALYFRPGQHVDPGQVLAEVRDSELRAELRQWRIEEQQSLVRSRVYQMDQELAAMQAESEMRIALRERADDQEHRLKSSKVIAPCNGSIMDRDVLSRVGSYIREGETLAIVGDEANKELYVSVAQDDIQQFLEQNGNDVDVWLLAPYPRRLTCRLRSVDPRAMLDVTEPALSGQHGGPLAVRAVTSSDESEDPEVTWELLEPRFEAVVGLTREQSVALRTGQSATVRLGVSRGRLWEWAYRRARDWIRARLGS